MSANAIRFGSGLNTVKKSTGYAYEVRAALVAQQEEDAMRAWLDQEVKSCIQLAHEAHIDHLSEKRKGCGVAWVSDVARKVKGKYVVTGREVCCALPPIMTLHARSE